MLYPEGRYNLNFDICAILLCLFILIFFFAKKDLKARRVRAFMWVVFFMILSSSAELTMDIFRNGHIPYRIWQEEAATFISHFAHNSIPFLMVLYFLSLTGLWYGMKKKQIVILSIPETLLVIFQVVTPLRRLLYYFTADGVYVRGPLYSFYYIIVGIYVAAVLWKHRSGIRRTDRLYILIIGLGFIISMIIGMANNYLRATNFLQALLLLGGFFGLKNEDSALDTVTGLYNGHAMLKDAAPLFDSQYESQVISVKMQHFNYYRLLLGVDAVRKTAVNIGAWLKSQSKADILFYRISYGEFAAIMFNHSENDAHELAEKLRSRFAQLWIYSDTCAGVSVPTQIWISSIPEMISNEEQMLVFVEAAYDDSLPKNRIYVADEINDEHRRISVDVAIRRALRDDTFDVYYQPIYNTEKGRICSCEALVRMNDPDLGFVSPEEFIKVAEQNGTISQIGEMVFEKVCRFMSEKNPSQYGLEFVEINLSTIQCMDDRLVDRFQSIMDRYGVSPEQIILEITESAVVYNEDRINGIIDNLHKAGFKFALDDFGTGHANYSYVLNFPFSIIKIDKSFLWSSETSNEDRLVFHNMLSLVRDLKLQTVVEGVETEGQVQQMEQERVRYLQGYYYSKPVPENNFLDYIRQFNLLH